MSVDSSVFATYVSSIRQTPLREKTEHTDRDAVKALLQRVAPPKIQVVHEAKGTRGKGTPDFKVRQNGQIVGYIEIKPIGTDLRSVLKSNQISRYRSLSKNILLTDYLKWIWINDSIQSAALCDASELTSRKLHLDPARVAEISKLLSGFASVTPQRIASSAELAVELAARGRLLKDFLKDELLRQEEEQRGERLYGLYEAFKQQVSEEITLGEFSDAFAQTLSYGLFLAKFNSNGTSLRLDNASHFIPRSFKLIQELVGFIDVLDGASYIDIKSVVDEIVSIINGLDIKAVREDLSFKNRKTTIKTLRARDEEEWRLFSRDPFVYFYEDYLAQYDATLRKSRGVYYTPPPIVAFIVRAIDDTLRRTFNLKEGLADHKRVTLLEFACGTGTFIVEAIQRILENVGGPASPRATAIIKEHALKNLFAFEFLIAPYTIAHLKLAQYLEDRQIRIGDEHRFNVYLTNTLEPLDPQRNFFLPALSEESKAAAAVKRKKILVITGNPPYSGHSKNNGEWISKEIGAYKYTVEPGPNGANIRTPLGEKNSKWLQDDYVKFIRFAQLKMDDVEEGIVGIITNHSYLDNPTFRGMRQSLMNTFDQIYILDLHGNLKKREKASDGTVDENVFDIEQGVAISIFVKKPGAEKGIWHADLRGTRIEKYKATASGRIGTFDWKKLDPIKPFYLFIPQNRDRWAEYEKGFKVTDMFPVNVLGFQTHRDHFALAFTKEEIESRIIDLRSQRYTTRELAQKYDLKDNRDWSLEGARNALKADKKWRDKIVQCDYRPFDKRWCLFGYELMDYPRRELLDHAFQRKNLHLLISRQTRLPQWRHVAVSHSVAESCFVSLNTKEQNYVFPMHLFDSAGGGAKRGPGLFSPNDSGTPTANISTELQTWLQKNYKRDIKAEQIFAYTFAVLNCPFYREQYVEFLRIDFPRVQFPAKLAAFEQLARLGQQLIDLHLGFRTSAVLSPEYKGHGNNEVAAIRYFGDKNELWINEHQYFDGLTNKMWDFEIGGYKVLEKILKSRKGRILSLEEIDGLTTTAAVVSESQQVMAKIDQAYKIAFS